MYDMGTVNEIVSWTEELCDAVEGMDPELFNDNWRKVSMPASIAAIRVLYYIGEIEKSTNKIYRQLHYLLTSDTIMWSSLQFNEKKALLSRLGITSVMVYV